MTTAEDIPVLLDALEARYAAAAQALKGAIARFLTDGTVPDPAARAAGLFAYPELRLAWTPPEAAPPRIARAFARLSRPGGYAASIARPALFRRYLGEQLRLLTADYAVRLEVGASALEIPYPYVVDAAEMPALREARADALARHFPTVRLDAIGDEIADGSAPAAGSRPLALFEAPRVDFSLARIRHYTGTPPEDVRAYVLFTNYHRYVDEFVAWAVAELGRDDSPYERLSAPGGMSVNRDTPDPAAAVAAGSWRRVQMPAYHLVGRDGAGVSLVNIGVGPSNAKTICDHLAVLRPEAWLMIGHCGGLRPSQAIGDYVLAHAYLRDDHVLDDVLPIEIPIPPIAEVQQALFRAAERVTGKSGDTLKRRLRTGTVVTTDDRNWELRFAQSARRFNQSRAVAIDMESATIAAQGYRFRVPYGTLLCVSDKPLHGEIKLPGAAGRFYDEAIGAHLRIGLETIAILRGEGDRAHSRKLRAFDEPPFR